MTDFVQRRTMMVDTQVRPADVTRYPVIAALLEVPRELYVPAALREAAYAGEHVGLGAGRVLLDARTFAKMLDGLDLQPDELVLDIGCGLGYSSAVIARLAAAVVAVEEDAAMAAEAAATLAAEGVDGAVVVAGPLAAGAPQHGPYDAIVIEGGVDEVPATLIAQLKEGGRICAIFGDGAFGACRIGLRTAAGVSWRFAFNAAAPVLPGFAAAPEFAL